MKSYQGAVLFIDMLGFGELTRGRLELTQKEYEPWKVDAKSNAPYQLLAAKLLLAFRKILSSTADAFEGVKVAQLSDCCFIWSDEPDCVINAGRYFMQQATLGGLLCRGGLAYGQIYEPDKVKRSIGSFIVGDAVTRAAMLERSGKGSRVFTDQNTCHEILKVLPDEHFQPLTNPLTGEIVDEWAWYASKVSRRKNTDSKEHLEAIKTLVSYHTTLRFSPKLAWSATTSEGRRQIACSIAALSQQMEEISNNGDFTFSVDSLLGSDMDRSVTTQKKIQNLFVNALANIVSPPRQQSASRSTRKSGRNIQK